MWNVLYTLSVCFSCRCHVLLASLLVPVTVCHITSYYCVHDHTCHVLCVDILCYAQARDMSHPAFMTCTVD